MALGQNIQIVHPELGYLVWVTEDHKLLVSGDMRLSTGDIQIGAVEIKDGESDTRAIVTSANALKVDNSDVSLTIGKITAPVGISGDVNVAVEIADVITVGKVTAPIGVSGDVNVTATDLDIRDLVINDKITVGKVTDSIGISGDVSVKFKDSSAADYAQVYSSGAVRVSGDPIIDRSPKLIFQDAQRIDDDPTSNDGSSFDTRRYRSGRIYVDINSTGTGAHRLKVKVQYSHDDSTWYDETSGALGNLEWEDTDTASGIKESFPLERVGSYTRAQVVGTNTTASLYFDVTVEGDFWN